MEKCWEEILYVSCAKYCRRHDHGERIDLHVHTTASDGACSPARIVELARKKGIGVLAITDHDTTLGLEEAARKAAQYPLELIPGIELSTVYDGHHEIHILGYYIHPDNPELRNTLDLLTKSRLNRARRMVEQLKNCGLDISFEEIAAKGNPDGSLGRPHAALVLVEKGVVRNIGEAFEKLLNPGCPGYVPRYKLSPHEAIALVKKAGGTPVLAHPGTDLRPDLLPSLLEAGLEGIEVFYPEHDRETERNLINTAQRLGLVITGGSDFHGHKREEWQYFGEMPVPPESVRRLKNLAFSRGPD